MRISVGLLTYQTLPENFAAQISQLTGNKGADIVFECVGSPRSECVQRNRQRLTERTQFMIQFVTERNYIPENQGVRDLFERYSQDIQDGNLSLSYDTGS